MTAPDLDKGGNTGLASRQYQGPTLGWIQVQDNVGEGSNSPPASNLGFFNMSAYAQNYVQGTGSNTAIQGVYVKNPVTTNNGTGAVVGGIEISTVINNSSHVWPSGVYGFAIGTPPNGVNVGTIRGGDFDGVFGGPGSADWVRGTTHYSQIDGGTVTNTACIYTVGPFITGGTINKSFGIFIDQAFGSAPSSKQIGLGISSNGNNNSFVIVTSGSDPAYFGGSVISGGDVAPLATTAQAGFLYIASCAGTPTGSPFGFTGCNPFVYDTVAHKLWVNDNGTWKFVTFS